MNNEEVENAIVSTSKGAMKHFEFQHQIADGSTKAVEMYTSAVIIGGKKYSMIVKNFTEAYFRLHKLNTFGW